MNYEHITIVSDIDDTIEDLISAWCKWLNTVYGSDVQPQHIRSWDMTKAFPNLTVEEIFEPLYYESFWEKVQPKEDAMKYLKMLYDEGFNIYLCTSTGYQNVAMKYEYIVKKYFPYIDWNHVIIAHDKHMIKCDYIIDDGVHNLIDCTECVPILMNAPHNQEFDADKYGIFRVNGWSEIYSLIHGVRK